MDISCKVSFPVDMPNRRGKIFAIEAFEKACQNIGELPITMYDMDGNSKVRGQIRGSKLTGTILNCEGQLHIAPSWIEKCDGSISFQSLNLILKQ